MSLRMPGPWKHPTTGTYYFRQRRPSEFKATQIDQKVAVTVGGETKLYTVGEFIKVSLHTKSAVEAKTRYREVDAAVQEFWQLQRGMPLVLSSKDVHALAGLLYTELVDMMDGEPGEASIWDEVLKLNQRVTEAGSADQWFGPSVDQLFAKRGIRTDPLSRTRVIHAAIKAIQQAAEANRKKALGDYSPDDNARRYPAWQPSSNAGPMDLFELLDHKFKSVGKPRTREDYRTKLRSFVAMVGHSDARRVTKDDVRNWRDKLAQDGLEPKTINDKYKAALSAVLSHGVAEYNLPENVAKHIRDQRKTAGKGQRGYTEEQARAILQATFNAPTKGHSAPHQRALFWVPWICAYQGLRVTEVTQLRGVDLQIENGIAVLRITPEAGSTKSGKAWLTAVHPHLIELGLVDMFMSIGDGPAFYAPYPPSTDLSVQSGSRPQEAGNRVADWIKDELGVPAPLGRPNHAWRHSYTSLSRKHAMDKQTRDYMLGSGPEDAREDYGEFPPEALRREIEKLPQFDVKIGTYRPTLEQVEPQPIRRGSNAAPVPKLKVRRIPRKPRT